MKKFNLIALLFLQYYSYSQYEIQYEYTMKSFLGNELSSAVTLKTFLFTDGIRSKFVKNRVINGKIETENYNSDSEFLELIRSKKISNSGDSIGEIVIKNNYNNTVLLRLLNASKKKYIKISETNHLEVKLLNEFKKIEEFNCQKAIIKEKYRTFEVWFTNEIPIIDGPWKLNGVPGLILYAESLDKTHEFKLTSIEKKLPFDTGFFDFPYDEELDKTMFIESYLSTKEKVFKYNKSTSLEGTTSKLTINNLEMPIKYFE